MGAPGYEGTVTPKLFKALLTLNAYVVLADGTEKIRAIQQWLNRTYLGKSTFFIGPCDGLYSRDVQTALMKAIQCERGVPENPSQRELRRGHPGRAEGQHSGAGRHRHPRAALPRGLCLQRACSPRGLALPQ
ncbi:hypothetical protein [Streptomyces parvus]|uniref:Uncharacterized protein n=1 Tax=Streptomyces parvus TaxID=66428 RepID=A0A7K3RWL9_9ACTN|nr:hypothetical protein [Streptomyces parvus]NEC19621.1 hypothetical protein [Streptomyces parvus]